MYSNNELDLCNGGDLSMQFVKIISEKWCLVLICDFHYYIRY